MSFKEKRCCQLADKQYLASVKNKGSPFQLCSELKVLELISFADAFFPTDVILKHLLCIPFIAHCPMTCLLQSHFSFQQLTKKKEPTFIPTKLQLINDSALINTHLHTLFQVHYNYHCTTFTLTCSFSCLMDCWRVSIWLNKGLLSVLRKTVRFSLCWESLFSRSFVCRRSRICSTCCLSAPQSSTCEEWSFISHHLTKVIMFRLHTCSRIFRHVEGYFLI